MRDCPQQVSTKLFILRQNSRFPNVTLIPFAEAIKDTFSISAIGTNHSLGIYNAQLCYVSGMPVYMLSGISDDKMPVTACAFAVKINDSQYAAQIYEALK